MDLQKYFRFFMGHHNKTGRNAAGQSEAENMRLYGIHKTTHFDPAAPAVVLTEPQTRVLATGALLLASWWLPLKQLMTLRPEMYQQIVTVLERDWGLETADELQDMIRSLLDGGHRVKYQAQLEENQAYWRARFDQDEFLKTMPVHSVAGWDLGRVVCLAYWGLLVGLLNQKTAFAYMEEANLLAQQHLTSWADLAASYLAGMLMWNPDDPEALAYYSEYAQFLLEQPQSVWRVVPWAGGR